MSRLYRCAVSAGGFVISHVDYRSDVMIRITIYVDDSSADFPAVPRPSGTCS